MLARATDPVARAAIESLLEDEIDHGRVGWAYLAERARARAIDGLAAALPEMLERTFKGVLDAVPSRRDESKLEACGYLAADTGADVYRRALRDVILPGFEQLGVDLAPSRERLRARGWD
jgi:hypothetical protein